MKSKHYIRFNSESLAKLDSSLDELCIEVIVEYTEYYEDNRFSFDYGDEHGSYDPGSGYTLEILSIVSNQTLSLEKIKLVKGDLLDQDWFNISELEQSIEKNRMMDN